MPRFNLPRGAVSAADGLVVVDKPPEVTSHDVVTMTRRLAATRKVGHAGTLDPMATGLLLLGIGKATRLLTYLVGADKTYEATIRLGQETLTEDAEGEITASLGCPLSMLDAERLASAMTSLTGEIAQVPSAVSAIKIDGVRSYKRVRDGEAVELKARPVTIHSFELLAQPQAVVVEVPAVKTGSLPSPEDPAQVERPVGAAEEPQTVEVTDVRVRVRCSSGTYIRALARDLGKALGVGAHLTALRRTELGPFTTEQASQLEAMGEQVAEDAASAEPRGLSTLPLADAARALFPVLELDDAQAKAVSLGQFLPAEVLASATEPARSWRSKGEKVWVAFAPEGTLVALLSLVRGQCRPVLVLDAGRA